MTNWTKNISAPNPKYGYYWITLDREVSRDDIRSMKLDQMPGFRFTWNYNKQEKSKAIYNKVTTTKEFVR